MSIYTYLVSVSEVLFFTLTWCSHVTCLINVRINAQRCTDLNWKRQIPSKKNLEKILQDIKLNPFRSNSELHMTVCKFDSKGLKLKEKIIPVNTCYLFLFLHQLFGPFSGHGFPTYMSVSQYKPQCKSYSELFVLKTRTFSLLPFLPRSTQHTILSTGIIARNFIAVREQ